MSTTARRLNNLILAGLAPFMLTGLTHVLAEKKPNVLIIYVDDMGWGDVGYHGYKDIRTPNIDQLAASGVWFSQGYVSASVCMPSRAGLLTGVYQQRFKLYGNYDDVYIPREQTMLPEMLKHHGYTCGMVGKWHLGMGMHPNDRGFDFFYGFLWGSHKYFESDADTDKPFLFPLLRNKRQEPPIQESNGYLTDLFTEQAVRFIETQNGRPFLLYLAYNAVHHPWEVPNAYVERLRDLPVHHEDRRVFAGMTLALDDGVGRVMDALKAKGITDDTVVFFISDNGSPRGQGIRDPNKDAKKDRGNTTMSSPGPFRGFKGDTYEGGIRVPFLMHWPSRLAGGVQYDHPVINLDIMPTIAARLGVERPNQGVAFDGVDLLPYLTGEKPASAKPHDVLYWRRDNDFAVRVGDWKLAYNDQGSARDVQLFNLKNDAGEHFNVAASHSEQVKTLRMAFDEWNRTLPKDPRR